MSPPGLFGVCPTFRCRGAIREEVAPTAGAEHAAAWPDLRDEVHVAIEDWRELTVEGRDHLVLQLLRWWQSTPGGAASAIPVPSRLMAASPIEAPRAPRAPWLLPALLVVMVLAALIAILLFANRAAEPDVPPPAGPFVPPAGLPYRAYDVELRSADGTLRLGSGGGAPAIEVNVPQGAELWVLSPATLADVTVPAVVNIIAVPNEVRNFAIRLVAFGVPGEGGQTGTGEFIPLASAFAGHEVSVDQAERTVISGVARSIEGNVLSVLMNGGRTSTLEIDPGAPVRVLRPGSIQDIAPGDRVALHLDAAGQPDPARGILVLTAD